MEGISARVADADAIAGVRARTTEVDNIDHETLVGTTMQVLTKMLS